MARTLYTAREILAQCNEAQNRMAEEAIAVIPEKFVKVRGAVARALCKHKDWPRLSDDEALTPDHEETINTHGVLMREYCLVPVVSWAYNEGHQVTIVPRDLSNYVVFIERKYRDDLMKLVDALEALEQ